VNGNCAIPADAIGVAMNVTAVNPAAQSNLRVYPGDVATPPTVSNLNFSAGQKPVANKVDVGLSPTGSIKVYNYRGTVAVVGDVVGYYTKISLQDLQSQITALQGQVAGLQASRAFSLFSDAPAGVDVTTSSVVTSLTVRAPVAGAVTLNASLWAYDTSAVFLACQITTATGIDSALRGIGLQRWHRTTAEGFNGPMSLTRGYTVAAGSTTTFNLVCRNTNGADSSTIQDAVLTATFAPVAPLPVSPPVGPGVPPVVSPLDLSTPRG
jgi:hypothetical protein